MLRFPFLASLEPQPVVDGVDGYVLTRILWFRAAFSIWVEEQRKPGFFYDVPLQHFKKKSQAYTNNNQ